MRTSMTSVPRDSAISPSDRPTHSDSGSATSMRRKSDSTPMARAATASAPDRSAALVAGSAAAAARCVPVEVEDAPASRAGRPTALLERIRIMSGRARATTWAPLAGGQVGRLAAAARRSPRRPGCRGGSS